MREISLIELIILLVIFALVSLLIAVVQKWWYKNHPYVNKKKLPYEEQVERWETLHREK